MIPQMIQLYKDKSFSGDKGTDTLPLKRNDQVLQYILQVRAKNGSTANAPDAAEMPTPEQALSKIEIHSGSTIMKQYTGQQCRQLATYRNGQLPPTLHTQVAGGTWAGNEDPALGWMSYTFPINFNLPGDPFSNRTGVILPAPLFSSLDLIMDFDFTVSDTAGFTTDQALFDLYALVLPKQSESEMLRKKILVEANKIDYVSVAAGNQNFPLTLDDNRFLRNIMITCYENGIGEGIDITEGSLRVNGSPLYNWRWSDQQAKNAMDCKLNYFIDYYMKNVGITDELWTKIPAPVPIMIAGTAPTVAPYFTTLGNGDKVTITTDQANDINLMRIGSNTVPGAVFIDMDEDGSLMNMQYQGVKDLEMILTNGGASGTVKILEQSISKVWGN